MSTEQQRSVLHWLLFGSAANDLRSYAKTIDGGVEGVATWSASTGRIGGGISGEQLIEQCIIAVKRAATEL